MLLLKVMMVVVQLAKGVTNDEIKLNNSRRKGVALEDLVYIGSNPIELKGQIVNDKVYYQCYYCEGVYMYPQAMIRHTVGMHLEAADLAIWKCGNYIKLFGYRLECIKHLGSYEKTSNGYFCGGCSTELAQTKRFLPYLQPCSDCELLLKKCTCNIK